MAYKESTLVLNKVITVNNYLISNSDFTIVCDASDNNITVVLPDAIESNNQIFDICVLNLDHEVKIVSINNENINDVSEFIFNNNPYTSIAVQAINGNYYIIDVHFVEELLGCCHYDSIYEITTEYFCSSHCGIWDGPGSICPYDINGDGIIDEDDF